MPTTEDSDSYSYSKSEQMEMSIVTNDDVKAKKSVRRGRPKADYKQNSAQGEEWRPGSYSEQKQKPSENQVAKNNSEKNKRNDDDNPKLSSDFQDPRYKHHRHDTRKKLNRPKKPGKPQQKPKSSNKKPRDRSRSSKSSTFDPLGGLNFGTLPEFEAFKDSQILDDLLNEVSTSSTSPLNFNEIYELPLLQLNEKAQELGVEALGAPNRNLLLRKILEHAKNQKMPVTTSGVFEKLPGDEGGVIVYEKDNYAIKRHCSFIPDTFIKHYGLKRGHFVEVQLHPPREGETCPFALNIKTIMGQSPDKSTNITPFSDLIPYYPTERVFLETNPKVEWDNLSMRVVDILTPIGLGQRGLIVAPPRTGKTMLLQGIAHSIAKNNPNAHLIILLIDERPEEVTDFKRQVTTGEVISSTFDQSPESHVHTAEMVIEKARRMVEVGQHVVILLDSITRLARAYNAMMPSSGKILSGGIEASSLQKPKRFFGSARNIEDAGSLTILASTLIETGSRMDEVIFEEFKGTSNMELHLDRGLVDKRIFPAINIEKSGTRKEELLYHPDEIEKIYALRRAMNGVPPLEAMEMLIQRIKKTKGNLEFLMALNR